MKNIDLRLLPGTFYRYLPIKYRRKAGVVVALLSGLCPLAPPLAFAQIVADGANEMIPAGTTINIGGTTVALQALNGGTIENEGSLTVITTGSNAGASVAGGPLGGSITLTGTRPGGPGSPTPSDVSITTSGGSAFGFVLGTSSQLPPGTVSPPAKITATNVDITTTGANAKAVRDQSGSMVILMDCIVTSRGDGAGGLDADNFPAGSTAGIGPGPMPVATIEATNTIVLGTGNSSRGGLQSENFGKIIMNGGTVTTTGMGSPAIWMNNGATLEVTGVTVKAEGEPFDPADSSHANVSSALQIKQSSAPTVTNQANTAIFTDSTLSSAEAPAITLRSGKADVSLVRTSVSGNSLLEVANLDPAGGPGILNLTATSSTLTGDVHTASGTSADITLANSTMTGNSVADSGSTLDLDLTTNSTLTGTINGAQDVFIDPSTWNMTGNSDITGDLILQGNLIVNSVAKFASTGQASVLTIGGNLTIGSGATVSLGIGGLDGSQYDHIVVGGNAAVNGLLVVNSLGVFHPSTGNAFEILSTGGTVAGNFGTLDESNFNNTPGVITGHLELRPIEIVAKNAIVLLYVAVPPSEELPDTGTGDEHPPVIDDPNRLPPVAPDQPVPAPVVLSAVSSTAEQLTALYEISFSGANTQRFSLDARMLELQQTIFPAPVENPEQYTKGYSKEGPAKEVTPPPAQPVPRWGFWGSGYGDWVNLDNTNSANGYNFTTGGMTAGIDYLITDHLAIGLFGGYSHTGANLTPLGSIDTNTGRGGIYTTFFDRGWWVNAAAWGGGNSYSTSRQGIVGSANGDTSGWEFSTFGEAGYDFQFGNLKIGPTVALQFTRVGYDGFTEHGSLVPLNIHSGNQNSLRNDVGIRGSYTFHIGTISVMPYLRAVWEYESKYKALPISFGSDVFPGVSVTTTGPDEGRNSAILNVGFNIQWTPRLSTFIEYDGQLGRSNYDSNGVTGGFSFSF